MRNRRRDSREQRTRNRPRRLVAWSLFSVLCSLFSILCLPSCTRHFYRERADKDVDKLLGEKDREAWKIDQFHIYPDPRARFADTSNPDRPPMPPDDPGADELSPHPQNSGKAGIGLIEGIGYLQALADWDAANRAAAEKESKEQPKAAPETLPKPAESKVGLAPPLKPDAARTDSVVPVSLAPVSTGEGDPNEGPGSDSTSCPDPLSRPKRPYLIKLEQAVELGTFNSREFQDRREDLYLSALPVTQQRFAFVAQFLAVEQAIREWSGSDSPIHSTNRWVFNSNLGVSQLFSTGGLLLLDFANQTVVDFVHFPKTISQSTATFNLIQPLLRGGGRAVTLEPLTQSERDLLYQVRNYARFRKEFFVSIAGGGGGSISGGAFVPSGVIITSNFSPGAGLGGSGLTPGVIAPVPINGVSPQLTPGQSGRLNLTKAIPPSPAPGYFGTLLQRARIANDQENIDVLERFLKLFQAFNEGGVVTPLQVDQVEQQLLQGRTTKLTDEQQFGNALDQFHIQLGLPTDLPLELEDSALRPLTRQFRNFQQVFLDVAEATQRAETLGNIEDARRLRAELRKLVADVRLSAGTQFRKEFPARWAGWERLSADELKARGRAIDEERRKLLDQDAKAAERQNLLDYQTQLRKEGKQLPPTDQNRLAELEKDGQPLSEAQRRRLAELDIERNYRSFEESMREYETQPWRALPNQTEEDKRRRQRMQSSLFRNAISDFYLLLNQARNERLDALRTAWPNLPPLLADGVDILRASEEEAFAAAARVTLENRLDLMNARAQLVDAWRQLAVFANALLGTVNLQYNMTSTTPAGQARPLAFGGSRYDNQLVINTQAPLVRIAERNNYRTSLIAYQRQRRALMEAEDLAIETVRGEVRQLRQLAESYRIQQRQVELAYLTVENSLDTFNAPPGPAGAAAGGQSVAAQAASLTQQLLSAQQGLPVAQNQLLSFWINYLNTRLTLYRDLELMPLDQRGVWIDDVATNQSRPAGTGAAGRQPAGQFDGRNGGQLGVEPCPAPTP